MNILRKPAARTVAIAAMIGAFGVSGASLASADTGIDLHPGYEPPGYCTVIDNDGNVETFPGLHECNAERSRITAEERREERREDRRDERREELRPAAEERRSTWSAPYLGSMTSVAEQVW